METSVIITNKLKTCKCPPRGKLSKKVKYYHTIECYSATKMSESLITYNNLQNSQEHIE